MGEECNYIDVNDALQSEKIFWYDFTKQNFSKSV
jgi:hypothetical protein